MTWGHKLIVTSALWCATGCYLHHTAAPDAGSSIADTGVPQTDATWMDAAVAIDAANDATMDATPIDAPVDATLDHNAPDTSVDAFVPTPPPGNTYFKPNWAESQPHFGESVALSADRLVVGAPYDQDPMNVSDDGSQWRGAVYVFARTANGWRLEQRLVRDSAGNGDMFGLSVAISGNTIVASEVGSAHVFVRRHGAWSPQARLVGNASGGGDAFGSEVSISDNTVIVGAPADSSSARGVNGDEDNRGAYASGAAYVFVRNGDVWSRQAYLKASNADEQDSFGERVAISNDTVVVSARYEASRASGVNGDQNDNGLSGSGAAYVFVRRGDQWTQQAYLKASNTEQEPWLSDEFGTSVAIDRDTVAVGAWAESSSATGVNGDQHNNDTPGSGAVYVFARVGATWTQQAYVKATTAQTNRLFGDRVALHGDTLVVGARADSDPDETGTPTWDDSGAVYLFSRGDGQWHAGARVRAPHAGWSDWFGWDVTVFGTSIAVGAIGEASTATGINGDQSDDSLRWVGAVYVFDAIDELGLLSP